MMTHKEMTKHIRNRIKASGIKARVRMQEACGEKIIQVFTPEYGVDFTENQQREIRHIAKCNRLSWVRGMEIDLEQMTNPAVFNFYYYAQ